MTTRIDFTYNGWDCWRNMFGEWGAILSRKGEQPIVLIRFETKKALLSALSATRQSVL
ncbi:MAG: hypothetical protein P4K93_15160 [Terracidiphilus sp.]|nr:hypothetical protein [Terracidiphilus sp.]MDR3799497.1 hypothetical protein [Terracidiphilus sp.]